MTFKLSQITPYLLYQFKSDADLIRAVDEISNKFTTGRNSIGDYLKDERLVSAYTVFYLLTNVPKLREVLKWMPSGWLQKLMKCDLIDLGAGPGTFSLAWKDYGGEGNIYQIEEAPLMREQAKRLWSGIYSCPLNQSHKWQWQSGNERFLLFGHSANEMGPETVLRYIDEINPEHILFIEPGTKDFFSSMLQIREGLLKKGHHVLYPCPKPSSCPMSGTEDWCHQFIYIKQDQEIERISQMARKDRRLLPLTVQAFSRSYQYDNPEERLVRVLPETKFSHEWEICHNNDLERYQVMKRDLTKQESNKLGDTLAGVAIETETIKTMEESKRVKFIKTKIS